MLRLRRTYYIRGFAAPGFPPNPGVPPKAVRLASARMTEGASNRPVFCCHSRRWGSSHRRQCFQAMGFFPSPTVFPGDGVLPIADSVSRRWGSSHRRQCFQAMGLFPSPTVFPGDGALPIADSVSRRWGSSHRRQCFQAMGLFPSPTVFTRRSPGIQGGGAAAMPFPVILAAGGNPEWRRSRHAFCGLMMPMAYYQQLTLTA